MLLDHDVLPPFANTSSLPRLHVLPQECSDASATTLLNWFSSEISLWSAFLVSTYYFYFSQLWTPCWLIFQVSDSPFKRYTRARNFHVSEQLSDIFTE